MEKALLNVFDNYFSTRLRLHGRASIIGTPDQNALLVEIPRLIEAYLDKIGVAHLFKVKGSIGNGNIARVPWVGIFRKEVTENAENGYYIVLLFSENMGSCYLSLNQGITAVEQLYTKSFALRKMREAALNALTHLECDPEAHLGSIDLSSTGDLGRGYEAAAIVSFKYDAHNLPSDNVFFGHLNLLLGYYEKIFKKVGKNLHSLISVSENEFQQVVLEKAASPQALKESISSEEFWGEVLLPSGKPTFNRSPIVAAQAIRMAEFKCEINSEHWTFTSRAKKHRYVEAHHLIPISQQLKFFHPLDVVENVVCLCATCHRMLHYGIEKERRDLLTHLFKQRKEGLVKRSLDLKVADFLSFYSGSVLLED